METHGDVKTLLQEIRIIGLQIKTNTSLYDALDEAYSVYYAYKQEKGESNAKHPQNFKSIVATIEHLGGEMFTDTTLANLERQKGEKEGESNEDDDYYKKLFKGKMMGVAFLKWAHQETYGKLMTSIRDQHSFKKDVYPKSLHEAYELLENHSS